MKWSVFFLKQWLICCALLFIWYARGIIKLIFSFSLRVRRREGDRKKREKKEERRGREGNLMAINSPFTIYYVII